MPVPERPSVRQRRQQRRFARIPASEMAHARRKKCQRLVGRLGLNYTDKQN
jgi:hypothetical protein